MRVMSTVAWHHPDVRPGDHKNDDDGLTAHQTTLPCAGGQRREGQKTGFVFIGRIRMIRDMKMSRWIVGRNGINLAEAHACLR